MSEAWVGFDFDGTLVKYTSGDASQGIVGEPIMPMVNKVKALLSRGIKVRIVTARVSGPPTEERRCTRTVIELWCASQFGVILPVTCSKDYNMICLYDDRAIAVEHGTGRVLGGEEP